MALVNQIDRSTLALNTIDYAHHEVHAGSHFILTNTMGLGSGITANYIITTPNTTKWAHIVFSTKVLEDTDFRLREGTTASNTGGAYTCFNKNRNSTNTCSLKINSMGTGATDGTLIMHEVVPADKFGSGATRSQEEWVLKQNTQYQLLVTSLAASNIVGMTFNWYEHTDKS